MANPFPPYFLPCSSCWSISFSDRPNGLYRNSRILSVLAFSSISCESSVVMVQVGLSIIYLLARSVAPLRNTASAIFFVFPVPLNAGLMTASWDAFLAAILILLPMFSALS